MLGIAAQSKSHKTTLLKHIIEVGIEKQKDIATYSEGKARYLENDRSARLPSSFRDIDLQALYSRQDYRLYYSS